MNDASQVCHVCAAHLAPSTPTYMATLCGACGLPDRTFTLHVSCLRSRLNAGAFPDVEAEPGIPVGARCCFCGLAIPRVGTHPFAFLISSQAAAHPRSRFWSHMLCAEQKLGFSASAHTDSSTESRLA
jgi:hypothetical protein